MPRRDIASLPPPTKFLTLVEVAARWRRAPLTTRRLLRKFGISALRLSKGPNLYAISELETIERASKSRTYPGFHNE
jgi:hypothetical protein